MLPVLIVPVGRNKHHQRRIGLSYSDCGGFLPSPLVRLFNDNLGPDPAAVGLLVHPPDYFIGSAAFAFLQSLFHIIVGTKIFEQGIFLAAHKLGYYLPAHIKGLGIGKQVRQRDIALTERAAPGNYRRFFCLAGHIMSCR